MYSNCNDKNSIYAISLQCRNMSVVASLELMHYAIKRHLVIPHPHGRAVLDLCPAAIRYASSVPNVHQLHSCPLILIQPYSIGTDTVFNEIEGRQIYEYENVQNSRLDPKKNRQKTGVAVSFLHSIGDRLDMMRLHRSGCTWTTIVHNQLS